MRMVGSWGLHDESIMLKRMFFRSDQHKLSHLVI